MGDLALRYDNTTGLMDLYLEDDDLATDDGLETAVLQSLYLDRRAEDEDVLPGGGEDDRRGHWGDEFPLVEGDKIGSRLWLLSRAPLVPSSARDAEDFTDQGLAWMIEDDVAATVEVSASIVGQRVSLDVVITRPTGDAVSYRFGHVWEGVAASAV